MKIDFARAVVWKAGLCMEIKQTTPTVIVSLLQTLMLSFVAKKHKTLWDQRGLKFL